MSDPPTQLSPMPVELIPIPIGDYVDLVHHPPLDADGEAQAIADLLAESLGAILQLWDVPPTRRDLAAVHERLTRWGHPERLRCSVLIWIGHGRWNDDDATLFVRGNDDTFDAEIQPHPLAEFIRSERIRSEHYDDPTQPASWVIFLVEAFGASRFVELLARDLLGHGDAQNILLIGAGGRERYSPIGTARTALTKALESGCGSVRVTCAVQPLVDLGVGW